MEKTNLKLVEETQQNQSFGTNNNLELDEQLIDLEPDLKNNDIENYMKDLFDTTRMQKRLSKMGYRIPVLLVERESPSRTERSEDFTLPTDPHDIYEEHTFTEFQQILARIQTGHDHSPELIRFKLDFQTIWEGLAG